MAAEGKKQKSEKRAVLVFLTGQVPGEAIKLRRDATIFGREKGDILIEDNEISSTHCQIQNINDVYHIFDMNSTNGTFVNSERIVKAKLKAGDVVMIGSTSFRFSLEEEARVRHIATIFKTNSAKSGDARAANIVDTLIDNELRSTQSFTIVLNVTYGDGKSEKIELKQKLFYIGRASSFGRFDQDGEISRKHLLVKLNDTGQVFVEDQGSTNGSFLNGKRLTGMHPVTPKDELRVGACKVKIEALRN